MKRSLILSNFFVYAIIVGLSFSLTSCETLDSAISTPLLSPAPPSSDASGYVYPDSCSENYNHLKGLKKSSIVTTTFSDYTACLLKCKVGSILGRKRDCNAVCKLDTDKLVGSFIETSDEESRRLRMINQSISNLQNCRNREADQIRLALRGDSAQREAAMSRYKDYKLRIEQDNLLIDDLLAASGKRIEESENAAREAGLLASSNVDTVQLNVKSGFNIRNEPSSNGGVVGKTSNATVSIRSIEGDWVGIAHNQRTAYVHRTAFPALTPQQKAELAHVNTKSEQKKAQESQYDYKKKMGDRIAEIDEDIEMTS